MKRIPLVIGLSFFSVAAFLSALAHPRDRISVTIDEPNRRVDVSIDGQPFTSYIWPTKLAKPVLYPLRTAKGTIVTRGFPLEPPRWGAYRPSTPSWSVAHLRECEWN